MTEANGPYRSIELLVGFDKRRPKRPGRKHYLSRQFAERVCLVGFECVDMGAYVSGTLTAPTALNNAPDGVLPRVMNSVS